MFAAGAIESRLANTRGSGGTICLGMVWIAIENALVGGHIGQHVWQHGLWCLERLDKATIGIAFAFKLDGRADSVDLLDGLDTYSTHIIRHAHTNG